MTSIGTGLSEKKSRARHHIPIGHAFGQGVVLALIGCAIGGPEKLDPNGSYPTAEVVSRETHHYRSGLMIFTETVLDLSDSDAGTREVHSGYTVYDEEGKRLSYVRQGSTSPSEMTLAPGKYLILLDRPGRHVSTFWVKVQQGRVTEVHPQQLPKVVSQN